MAWSRYSTPSLSAGAHSTGEEDMAQDGDVTRAHGQGRVVSQPEVTLSLGLFFSPLIVLGLS